MIQILKNHKNDKQKQKNTQKKKTKKKRPTRKFKKAKYYLYPTYKIHISDTCIMNLIENV